MEQKRQGMIVCVACKLNFRREKDPSLLKILNVVKKINSGDPSNVSIVPISKKENIQTPETQTLKSIFKFKK